MLKSITNFEIYVLGQGGLSKEILDYLTDCFPTRYVIQRVDLNGEVKIKTGRKVFLGMGDPRIREDCYIRNHKTLKFPSFVHPEAKVSKSSFLDQGSFVSPGAIISPTVNLGLGVFVNLNATIGHDSSIGNFAVLNPGATVSGGVQIGARVMVGANATILENICIGTDVKIGAGAVVTKDVAPGMTVIGVPAREKSN